MNHKSFRFSERDAEQLAELAETRGESETAVIRSLIHEAHAKMEMGEMKGKLEYIGEPTRTRGENGEDVRFGHVDRSGYVHVWDSAFGWSLWGRPSPDEWRETGEPSELN